MQKFELKVNDRIEVLIQEKAYKSIVQDIGEDFININLPVNNGEYLTLRINDKIEINSYIKGGNCFNFYCNVIERGRENNIIYYKLCKPYSIAEIQRRDFVRVDLLSAIKYKNITGITKEKIELIPYNKALMVDLSGGGIRFKTKEKLKNDDLILIELVLNEQVNYLKSQVIRSENSLDNEYICGVKFLEISDNKREKIIKEIFRIMRRQRETL
ncbi:flagellar brake protein [Clostridium uliginosum]|uniref:C-di-GMP-binding flagellar brake protein YcgR, contains PilZNR and PilZ domains n=1 Tax=Clostridium uliginosum TaxID=119641 RepID=A0A1I1KM46_9CLOT|nr:flagellar brake domain-containing protein [Clostridium uliginosum]SFC61645.1 c-di-GMP-binding flagellar brake protein YcgR, contains PilZNR and PilZ domains [Clostridium uliginosum]